ncbi:HAD-IIB family hydrolase [Thomasclavelia spiroformis]|uniref:HAD-IIB family hydrolase n=1 Tax=Thomasclavelia spiroformis TaxID=29348 RepID=UPI003995375A
MNKKYFFFDIDGTLTDKKTNKVVPSALKALKKLQDNGHFVAIATGRAHYKAINFMREIGLKNMVCNGGHGLVVNEQLVKNVPLDFQKCLAVIEQANQLGYGVLVAPYDNNEVYGKDFLFLKQAGFRKEPSTYYFDSNYDFSKFNDIYKMYISIPQDQEYLLTLKDTVGHLRFEKEYLMFQPDEKRKGIEGMIDYLQGEIKDVVVFGDDYNDIDMFQGDWYSIAMGNACDELKKIASEVTDSNVNDGIYNVCMKHNWI